MGTVEHRKAEFERYPKFKQAYIRAFDRMIKERDGGGIATDSTQGMRCSENGSQGISDDGRREIQLLADEQVKEASIEIVDKRIEAIPKWRNADEVIEWWIH